MNQIPMIKNDNGIPTLYVKGEPFFALSGEIHNSSSSSLQYMEENVWPMLKELHMNSVIVPLYWEAIEPEEGKFDFALLDGLILQARQQNMKLIFLWFGLWKNAESMYVPGWVKQDTKTYFLVKKVSGEKLSTISPLCEAAVKKDANAFAEVMAHIKKTDEEESTVIVMQVENEIGILGSERDYGEMANAVFAAEIPAVLAEKCGKTGDWKTAFGKDAEEYFMAYHYANAVETITAAGQKEYPLPCYVNAWLKQYPWYPGSYPSGGPVKGVHWIWKLAAPSLFTCAPDIYVPYVTDVFEEYSYEGNPLLIPEVRQDVLTASYCMYAFGKYNAICYSPFGIEDLALPAEAENRLSAEVLSYLNIASSAFDITGSKEALSRTYELIENMKPIYLKYRGTSHLQSYCKKSDTDYGTFLSFEKYDLSIRYAPKIEAKPMAAGMVYELEANKFLLVGFSSTLTFRPKAGENMKVDYIKLEEGNIVNGEWKQGRIMNGDEKRTLRLEGMPTCYLVEVYQY
ncbi:DUF5597 domain-containing protein [Robinsoniella peoriensis]|uniref:DUF5597 domain-containing protein n=1 Tax=Robinsoniella peoriensis TaxID=180332 RepID=UPI00085BFAA6|nr:DUF5597 domain-containing protein [Robinsoniella peoriensis]